MFISFYYFLFVLVASNKLVLGFSTASLHMHSILTAGI